MKRFEAAYLRLTAWYVAIIMIISLLFSFWVYTQARNELRVGLKRVIELGPTFSPAPFGSTAGGAAAFVDDRLEDSRRRVITRLVLLNTVVLIVGAGASYWLAHRTMRPIEEAVEAQERFTADASHELRTPLAAMKTEIEVGLRDKSLGKQEAVELLKSNLEEIDRLGSLADGLLALTQADQPAPRKAVLLHEVAGTVIKRIQPLADEKRLTVKRDLQPTTALADETTVDKILSILLDNALKYSPNDTTVRVRTYQEDEYSYLSVIDQGIGIKASELPHIFERFYRADSSRSKSHVAGHGLGLSIAQKLAENLDAKIMVTSTPGKGSEFTVRFTTPA